MTLSPVALSMFGFQLRWYSLAYLFAAWYAYYPGEIVARRSLNISRKQWHDIVEIIFISGMIGGRIGHCIFYDFWYCILNPMEIFYIWHGGMSFFGAMIGAFGGMWFCKVRYHCSLFRLGDVVCTLVPVGLGFGRFANILNSECVGKVMNGSYGFVFPLIDQSVRYPTQLIEAVLEGLVLFLVMQSVSLDRPGLRLSLFFFIYGLIRLCVEPYKEIESTWYVFSMIVNPSVVLALLSVIVGVSFMVFVNRKLYSNL